MLSAEYLFGFGGAGAPRDAMQGSCLLTFRHIARQIALAVFVWFAAGTNAQGLAEPLSYNRDIRPILVENCFSCHGADSASRKADLRLDRREDAIAAGVIVPGDSDSTPILDRIGSIDPDVVMPPPSTKKSLTAEQKKTLERWVAEGAHYEPHWSFIAPTRPELPAVKNEAWVRNPIDRFILSTLEAKNLLPAAEADRQTIARRVAFDLTGLPPDPSLVTTFVADKRSDAYERLVDSLLASPQWGEHRGRYWLDYARFADTHGIHFDNYREMWSFREWVIEALNANIPFDRFTILQLAGDLLPTDAPGMTHEQAIEQRMASGFNRCNITTNEGGSIAEEYLVLYTRDRTETTSQVWLGLTAGCAVCHDHKFDPLSQREFYEMAAFFNNSTQSAMDGNIQDTPPIIVVPRDEDLSLWKALEKKIPHIRQSVEIRKKEARPDFEAFLTSLSLERVARVSPQDTPVVALPLNEGQGNRTRAILDGKEVDLELTPVTTWQAGPSGRSALLLSGKALELPAAGDFEWNQPFTTTFWIKPPSNDSFYAVSSRMNDLDKHRGWDVWVQGRRVGMHLVHAWNEDAFKASTKEQLKADAWTFVGLSYDGSGKAEGLKVFFDGKLQPLNTENNTLKTNSVRTTVALRIGDRMTGAPAMAVGLADYRIWGRALGISEIESLARAAQLAEIIAQPVEERLKNSADLYEWWVRAFDTSFQSLSAELSVLEREQADIKARGTVAHVMNEKAEMPKAFVLERGEYDKRLNEVTPDTPDQLPPFPEQSPRNRLGFAQWLLLPEHPLTARVTVNRFWQEVFSTGLVRSSGDFGITGELPSHPELLDWMAVEFRESGWDMKKFFRLLVTSAAYRQQSLITPEKLAQDPDNRLISRGPRFRMDAEMVRDSALAASGLLVKQIGGPSVKPYQPDGVWEAVSMGGNTSRYQRDSGNALYRRSMYWLWKRSAPPASMDIFNAPSRETCTVKRDRTNTPLQALVTLNDPQFVEAARMLAYQALTHGGESDQKRIDFVSSRLMSRSFDAAEQVIVQSSLNDMKMWYAAHPEDAKALLTVGESKTETADPSLLAAWTMMVNELMNLDEMLCK